mgnify:CR=1 FL=1
MHIGIGTHVNVCEYSRVQDHLVNIKNYSYRYYRVNTGSKFAVTKFNYRDSLIEGLLPC